MAKLEELTALLVNEINDFNKGIEKLERINDQLKSIKIKMDVTEYKSIIELHQQKMASHKNAIERFESRFENQLKTVKIYPTWAVIVFIAALILTFSTLFYAYNLKQQNGWIENDAYQRGMKSYQNHIMPFFENNPKAKESFEQWKKGN